MANSVDPDQTAPIGAVCSGSTLYDSILNLSVMLGNYLQQTTSADDIFRCIFFSWGFNGYLFEGWLIFFHIFFSCMLIFFKINFFKKIFQEYHQHVKQFGSRSKKEIFFA